MEHTYLLYIHLLNYGLFLYITEAFEMWCYRRLLRIPWTQHKMNEWILYKLKVDRELLDRVKSLKLGFYGHMTRKYESLEKEMVQGCVPGSGIQKSWTTTPVLDRWHHRMDWDEDQWSGSSSGRSQQLERYNAPPTILMEEGTERRRRRSMG